jgi:transposase-like protein
MKRYNAEEKAMWVEDWKGSGKSVWAYAKENGLNGQTIIRWTKEAGAPQPFVEVRALPPEAVRSIPEIVIEKGDVKVHLPRGITGEELRAVIAGMQP